MTWLRTRAVPVTFFSVVLGLLGLGGAWRAAHAVWGVPVIVGESVMAVGLAAWALLVLLYGLKWLFARPAALGELRHPVGGAAAGLVGVTTLLASIALVPHSRALAQALFLAGTLAVAGFAAWRTASLWRAGGQGAADTPILYLPTVAGGFVMATAAAALGFGEVARLAFGAAFFSWLALESVLLQRILAGPPTEVATRPLLGIHMAPPAVGAVASVAAFGEAATPLTLAMTGYALLQTLVLLALLPWIREQAFSMSYWAFSFGATALGGLPLRFLERADSVLMGQLAAPLFLAANLVIGLLVIGTMRLVATGRLLPQAQPAASAPVPERQGKVIRLR